jgi:dihydrofolate reductase
MRPVVLQVFDYSLDGIIAEEDTEFFKFCRGVPDDPAHEAWLVDSLQHAGVHVVGRVTYQGMAQYFPTATGGIADAMNRIPKVVFSRTLQATDWAGTTIVSGDIAIEIGKLRQEGTGDILVHGGVSFARTLAELDLVDEYRLTVYPYVAATGPALFSGLTCPRSLELVSSVPFATGILALTYRRRQQRSDALPLAMI